MTDYQSEYNSLSKYYILDIMNLASPELIAFLFQFAVNISSKFFFREKACFKNTFTTLKLSMGTSTVT